MTAITESISSVENISSLQTTSTYDTGNVPVYSYNERIFIAAMFSLISISGTFGNSLIIAAVLLSKKLRTPTNVFVVNLSIADLFASLFLSWSVVALLGKDGWPLPNAEWLCQAGGFVLYTCTGTSLFNLAAIAINRLILITQSYRTYMRIYSPFNLALMVALTWFISFSVILVFPLLDIGGVGYDEEDFTCSDLDGHPKAKYFHLAQSAVFYPVPLLTIVICYSVLFAHVRRHISKQRKNSSAYKFDFPVLSRSSGSFSSAHVPGRVSTNLDINRMSMSQFSHQPETPTRRRLRHQRLDNQQLAITKNLFVIVCVFVLCCSPYCIALILPDNDHFLLYGGIFILTSSAINPLVYGSKHPNFKEVLGKLLSCNYEAIPEPSRFLKHLLKTRGLQPSLLQL
ncbi:melatonin receptor type 1B-like [Amphiura filiformis]|uniref:melatonin receptor type 1B-like n=1 Tax=Amphiura filiformis TaxID=82378 RepID=UPI003B21B223